MLDHRTLFFILTESTNAHEDPLNAEKNNLCLG